LGITFAVYMSQ